MMNFLLAQAGGQQPAAPPLQPLPHPDLPEVFLPPAPLPLWIFIVGGVLLVALLSLVLWLLLRPKPPAALPPKRPWQAAMRALKEVSSHVRSQTPGQTAAQVSEILRVYFMDRYRIPAPFRTSREIFVVSPGDRIPHARVLQYAGLAALWDELSFAPQPSGEDEAAELVARAMKHLEEERP